MRDGSGFASSVGAEGDPGAATLVLVARDGRVTRRALLGASRLRLGPCLRFSRDGKILYGVGKHEDGRAGVWAIPATGAGEPRLVIAFDDPVLVTPADASFSLGADRLYLTVADYESDVWAAKLQ
jgi:hypothetical protein